jgi:hypothetical protein
VDRKLANKNIRVALMVGAFSMFMFGLTFVVARSGSRDGEHRAGRGGGPSEPVPPVGEEIHLPGPSILPLLLAVGITLRAVGVTVSIALVVIGLAITIPSIVLWIRTTRADIAELPPEPPPLTSRAVQPATG